MFRVGGWKFSGWEFFSYPFRFVYKIFFKFAFCLLKYLDFLPASILKTLAFRVIFGRCLLFSLVFSILFYVFLLLKSRFHFFFGSNLKKILWECNYLEVLCRIIVQCLWKSFVKEFKSYFRIRKIRKVLSCFGKRNNCFSGQLFLWNSFRECF